MNNRYALVFAFPFLLIILIILFPDIRSADSQNDTSKMRTKTVNTVIGDESYIAKYGKKPGKNVPERLRIRTHLEYVEHLLRQRSTNNLSLLQQKNRVHNLNLLNHYIQAGNFPHNDGNPDPRRPVFMDKDGNICAVGYLLEQTAGRAMVKIINKKYKYAFIQQVDSPKFDRWAKKSGFTKRELAMIQPTYNEPPVHKTETKNKNRLKTGYGIGSAVLLSANAIYLSNGSHDPWLFKSPRISHIFGLAVGTGDVLLGALNLNNSNIKQIPRCGIVAPCWIVRTKQMNHLRTGVSMVNIGIGLISIIRSTYHLMHPPKQHSSKADIGFTHLQTALSSINEPVPALQFRYNF